MTTPPAHPPPATSPAAPRPAPLPPPPPNATHEWGRLWRCLIRAGGVFPVVVLEAFVLWSVLAGNPPRLSSSGAGYLGAVFVATFGAVTAFLVGCLYVAYMSLFGLFAAATTVRVTSVRVRWDHLGVMTGSLVAFIAFLPIAYFAFAGVSSVREGVVLTLLGVLAVLCGQVGGAYAGLLNLRDREAIGVPSPTGLEPVRFSLRQIMAMTVVASAALTLLRVAGLLTETMMHVTVVWLVLTTLLYKLVLSFVRWRLDRKCGWSRGPGWREEYRRWREESLRERKITARAPGTREGRQS